jgi:acetoin utilization deacetylase AcuC-like enzyme
MLKTALITDRHYLDHLPGKGHPERPERVKVLIDMADGLHRSSLERMAPREATVAEIELAHDPRYVAMVRETANHDSYDFDPDTHTSPLTYHTSVLAAGGVLTAVEAVLEGEAENSFAIVRPPGHHALPDHAMGFCFFNNVAIAAAYLTQVKGLERVMILDWDVHHGNGTAETFRRRSDVLFASIHQAGIYPGSGSLSDVGSGPGEGYTINLPVPAGSEEDLWLSLIEHIVLPAAQAFAPELVLVSAGFDAHREDPLAGCRLETSSFAEIARHVRAFAERLDVPLGVVLEGGYAPAVLGQCVLETLTALAGDEPPVEAAPEALLTSRAAAQIGHYWPL